jgi:hypothetical protein
MKKQIKDRVKNNIIGTDDEKTVLEITNSLKKIDQLPLFTPDLEWFEVMAFESKAIIKKRFRKDLTIFLLIAAIIITGVIVTLFQMPIIFFVIQIMVIVFVAVYSGTLATKKVEDV